MKRIAICLMLASALMVSCKNERYYEKPFGGMKGQVEMATEIHSVPKVLWPKQEDYNPIYYTNVIVYDPLGNEIASAFKDDQDYILGQTENIFEGRTCVKSIQKTEGKVRETMTLVADKGDVLEYERVVGKKTERMTVRSVTRGHKSRTEVRIDGKVQSTMVLKFDNDGYPVEVVSKDFTDNTVMRDYNVYDADHNIIEKHNQDEDGEEQVLFTTYLEFDAYGNWTKAATFDGKGKPKEEIVREIKYW